MTIKPGLKDVPWMAAGAAALLAVVLLALHFRTDASPAALLASKARRVDLVNQMRLSLASASEAEKSAVLAITDKDSQTYADQARATSATVDREQKELGELLTASGQKNETDLLAQFTKDFTEFQRIDKDLLELAGKNTNLKAYALAFGPAADALKVMDAALDRFVQQNETSYGINGLALFALQAEIAAQQIQSMFAPHIAEESDLKMDEMEAVMSKKDQITHNNLVNLMHVKDSSENPDIGIALESYNKFRDLKAKIIALSRENTNVRSLAISLNQKRKAMLVCQDDLAALQQAILAEPIPGVTYGAPSNPR